MRQRYFQIPFAFAGDQTPVENALQPSGVVSFNQGWTFDYQRDQSTDPLAKPIDRTEMNYIISVITDNLCQYQQNGFPEFITADNNGGTPYPYSQGAFVLWSASGNPPFSTFVSLVDNNTSTPGDVSRWKTFDATKSADGGIVPGFLDLLPFRVTDLPQGWYPATGVQYALNSLQGNALNNLPVSYKTDWRITISGSPQLINTPNLYHTDGRGLFLRPSNSVGTVIGDAIRNITGSLRLRGNDSVTSVMSSGGAFGVSSAWISDDRFTKQGGPQYASDILIDASRVAPTASENRPLHVGATPAIFLGV